MAEPEYQRLTRAQTNSAFAVAVVSRTSLWLAPDHLLLISTNGYAETYKRFYFRDIQALITQRTAANTIFNIVLAVPFVLAVAFGLVVPQAGGKIFLLSLAGLLALLALINLVRGQTCRCFLRTAVQTEPLLSLKRVRGAEKVFNQLRPLIVAAQGGELTPQMISERMQEPVQAVETIATNVTNNPPVPPVLDPDAAP